MLDDGDGRQHAAGVAVFGAMRKQQIGAAGGAQRRGLDVLSKYSGLEQLAANGLHQIEMQLGPKLAVARRACREKQQRILVVQPVRICDLVEELSGVAE